jgi:hypothetical protein
MLSGITRSLSSHLAEAAACTFEQAVSGICLELEPLRTELRLDFISCFMRAIVSSTPSIFNSRSLCVDCEDLSASSAACFGERFFEEEEIGFATKDFPRKGGTFFR